MKKYHVTVRFIPVLFLSFLSLTLFGNKVDSTLYQNLKFRSLGPSLTSGRIADFAVNPENQYEYYVAVASGNIWKTENGGVTFNPVFDSYGAYSIGCLAIDPNNPHIVWAGTGENNSQRALGYGDGVYKTLDGGKSWTNTGLKESRQIGKILIDPRNTNIVYVAAEGSVWGPGGDRGLCKTTDGGKSWNLILEISENTGVSDIAFDPSNPDIIYATSHQRRRRSFTKINGGPETAIYKSTDAGKSWRKLTSGLPSGDMGSIGIAVSPADPDYVYAIIEAKEDEGGFYRSVDKGESWQKIGSYFSNSPQYYHEIFCDPIDKNKVYSMDTYAKVTLDGGKTFKNLSNEKRHVDDHALWIDPNYTDHLIIGGDGGVYETFDGGSKWDFISNLPVTQFYRINVDNAKPFYNVYGGTQDNNTLTGPSQNTSSEGVTNDEWIVTLGGDGFWVGIDQEDPNIIYCEYQYGNAYRFNPNTGELFGIKPQEEKNELTYKWNWDSPLITSKHKAERIYMAANFVFMSDDRGNSWQRISDDLTRQKDRNSFKVMGKFWSANAIAKDVSTSQWGTIVDLAESPLQEGLLYAGTDDGLIQVTTNNGKSWQKIDKFPDVPEYTYVSDIFPSRFDANVVYATFNNHKSDDFKPYILVSNDQGKSWKNISSTLPTNGPVNTITQDFIDPELLFAGTEFGVFFSIDNGTNWEQLKSGIPTICVKDLKIQERECDLVVGTFGRGIYLLEDYDVLREFKQINSDYKSKIFPIKTARLFIPTNLRSKRGDSEYYAKNPEFGATFTYYLNETATTDKEDRLKKEKELFKNGEKIPVISWEASRKEKLEDTPYLLFVVKDAEGNVIRKLTTKATKGINRITWDLKFPDIDPIPSSLKEFDPFAKNEGSFFITPGTYYVSMSLVEKNSNQLLQENIPVDVKPLKGKEDPSPESVSFRKALHYACLSTLQLQTELQELVNQIQQLKQTYLRRQTIDNELSVKLNEAENIADDLDLLLNGLEAKASREEIPPAKKPISDRIFFLIYSVVESTANVSENQIKSLNIVKEELEFADAKFKKLKAEVEAIEKKLNER